MTDIARWIVAVIAAIAIIGDRAVRPRGHGTARSRGRAVARRRRQRSVI